MVKIAMDTRAPMDKPATKWSLRADAEYIREDVEFALKTLNVDYIDIIVLCRAPRDVSIESAVEGMA
jgi:aryl-alcohol dehydrogenase-like predicted oxidoreductase